MNPSDEDHNNPTAVEIYHDHPEAVDRLAQRDDKTAIVFQAIKNLVGDTDD